MTVLNMIGIVAVVLVLIVIVLFYKRELDKTPEDEEVESIYSISYLTNAIAKAFADSQKENLKEMNLTKKELEAEQRKKHELRSNLKKAAHGDAKAKVYIKSFIKSILQDETFGINPDTINYVIPFNQPKALDTHAKVDIIFHIYYKEYADMGFVQLMNDYKLNKPKDISIEDEMSGKVRYNFSKEDADYVYEDLLTRYSLSYDDKLEIITQRIFADYKGFGAIDMLFDFSLDEIEGGVNGVSKGFLEIKNKDMSENFEYTYESVYVVYKGLNIKMGCISFGSQKELVRICKNIYKFQTAHALSRSTAHVVATMRDGSRVSVTRPPEANSWAFCVRKFDSVSSVPTPQELLDSQNQSIIPITLAKWIMYTQRSTVITGGMGTGKTTFLKSIISYIPSEKNLRTYEISPELNLQNVFPQRNIVSFFVTESTSMQELYDFGKKFTANVNVIGETASAEMGVISVESARVGSEQALTTHHATTTENLITALRDNLTTAGGYSDEAAAEEVIVNVFNFDIHMGRIGGKRFIERITEIVPIRDRRYPAEFTNLEATSKDTLEYYRRSTDRKSYTTRDICVYDPETNSYQMKNAISDTLINIMSNKLAGSEVYNDFISDMKTLESLIA